MHALVVHAAAVLVPMAALGVIGMAVSVRLSRNFGWLVVLGAGRRDRRLMGGQGVGGELRIRVGAPGYDHDALGDVLPLFAAALLLAAGLLWWIDRAAGAGPQRRRGLRIAVALLAVAVGGGQPDLGLPGRGLRGQVGLVRPGVRGDARVPGSASLGTGGVRLL